MIDKILNFFGVNAIAQFINFFGGNPISDQRGDQYHRRNIHLFNYNRCSSFSVKRATKCI